MHLIAGEGQADMRRWRHHLHTHPEFGFEEHQTAAFVAAALRGFGIAEVETGIGGTGVVATLRRGTSNRAIGLRADMDALRITETGTQGYVSQTPGVMHACGHDGHTAMLLGAAQHLADRGRFDGVIHLIFQPAEEWGAGMQAMLDDGLLTRFPMDEAYGLHNMPGLPVGQFATAAGPIMAAEDNFEIRIAGSGGHSSRPHEAADALLAASELVVALQTLVSRQIDTGQLAVVSVTKLDCDGTRNAIASNAVIRGDCRAFDGAISRKLERGMRALAEGCAAIHGCRAELDYGPVFVPLVNDAECTGFAVAAAAGLGPIEDQMAPIGASEDFARLLGHVPGNFMFLGNGNSAVLHHPSYDFADAALPFGAAYFVRLAETRLQA